MKKLLTIIMAFLCMIFCACSPNKDSTDSSIDVPDYIELTIENYEYYLSIQKVKTDSGSFMGGSRRWVSYAATINGTVYGLYENCILSYKYNDSEQIYDIKLNASGFATFEYTVVNGNNISYVAASGRIHI